MADGPADRIGKHLRHITNDLKRYVEKRMELIALNIGEQSARMIAESAQKIAGLVLIFGALVFLLIALALYLGALLDSRSLGFVLVSAPFLLCGYLFLKLKPSFITRKLKSEFEEELIGMLSPETNDRDERKLISTGSPEIEKKKQHDVKQ